MFDMTVYVADRQEGFDLSLVYDADLFDAARMKDLLVQYEQLIEQIVADPAAPITAAMAGMSP